MQIKNGKETLYMKKEYIVKCENCGRNYGYESTGNPWPGGKDRGTAYCPYCNAEGPAEFISGFIYTYKLDDDGKPIKLADQKNIKRPKSLVTSRFI